MSIKVWASAAWHAATKLSLYTGGAWHEVLRVQAYLTDPATGLVGWREIYKKGGTSPPPPPAPAPPPPPPPPPVQLSVSISPPSIGSGRGNSGVVTTGSVTAAATGGSGTYVSYRWDLVTYSGGAPVALSPNAATTAFQNTLNDGDSDSATFKVVVTDDAGNVGSALIDVHFNSYFSGYSGNGGFQL